REEHRSVNRTNNLIARVLRVALRAFLYFLTACGGLLLMLFNEFVCHVRSARSELELRRLDSSANLIIVDGATIVSPNDAYSISFSHSTEYIITVWIVPCNSVVIARLLGGLVFERSTFKQRFFWHLSDFKASAMDASVVEPWMSG
ncbi:MAG: hypothetical protein K2Z81_01925, partial [Cyanobacteria bacterium]|nr:hypothetical protein [Cyanobacteriota bacterium]